MTEEAKPNLFDPPIVEAQKPKEDKPEAKYFIQVCLRLDDTSFILGIDEDRALTKGDIELVVDSLREEIYNSKITNASIPLQDGSYIILPRAMLDRSYIAVNVGEELSDF